MYAQPSHLYARLLTRLQGLEGDILFSGSTPALGDFDIRVVEGNALPVTVANAANP